MSGIAKKVVFAIHMRMYFVGAVNLLSLKYQGFNSHHLRMTQFDFGLIHF